MESEKKTMPSQQLNSFHERISSFNECHLLLPDDSGIERKYGFDATKTRFRTNETLFCHKLPITIQTKFACTAI